MSTSRTDPKFERAYARGILRSAFVSLFWAVITERRKKGPFTLKELAKKIGANKTEVSRWFKNDPNWTVNTIANLAEALNLEITITAKDRVTNQVFTPAGLVQPQSQPSKITSAGNPPQTVRLTRHDGAEPLNVDIGKAA